MELKLAKNETLVKSWDYAIGKGAMTSKKKQLSSNLTVTDRRVVYSAYNDFSLDRKELPIDSVVLVQGNYTKNPILMAIIKLVLGILSCCVIIGILFKGFGIKMIKDAIDTIKGCNFELKLITELNAGVSFSIDGNRGKIKLVTNKFKINVDKDKAKDILNEIGALVQEAKMAKEALKLDALKGAIA